MFICNITYSIYFSKDEADQEAIDIRQRCDDYVLNLNDLQNQILVVKTPQRCVNDDKINKSKLCFLSL